MDKINSLNTNRVKNSGKFKTLENIPEILRNNFIRKIPEK